MEKYMGEGSYPKWGTHKVEVTLQSGPYIGTIVMEMGGNCLGAGILTSVISSIEDGDFTPKMSFEQNDKHIQVDFEGYPSFYKLYPPDPTDDEDYLILDYDDDSADKIIGVRIIAFEEDSKEAVS
jgi:hypothetical protein